jgi:glycosyltransferase involved in cell wall biosynthesis
MKPLLVRDLALERWPSMDRYAVALASRIEGAAVADGWQMGGPRYLTRYWRYPNVLKSQRGDIVHILDHSYAHCLRAFPSVPSVITVHDLYPLRVLAESQRTLKGAVRDTLLRWVLHWVERADRIIVSTAFTSREVQRFLNVPAQKICVIPYGVDAPFFERPSDDAIRFRRRQWIEQHGGSDATVLLHVGSCHPRKNVEAAITATGLLREAGRNVMLVQLGGTFEPTHLDAIRRAGVADHVLQEGHVDESLLITAYHAADVLVIPSTFEGYGLPVVEAQAAGLPVVTSGAGGLREAAGDAGLVTGTVAPQPLADVIDGLLNDPALRAQLVERGKTRAAALTWEHTAQLTRAVYDEVLGR